MSGTHYQVLVTGDRPTAEIEIKRSRFIGLAARVATEQAARDFLDEVRRANREARHVCHGFVLGPGREIQRSSDDGEPAGTAGAPILKAITARQGTAGLADLSDVVVAVVRYFGGVKLGAGPLAQAYSEAAASTLAAARMTRRQRIRELAVQVPMGEAGRLETTLRNQGMHVQPAEYLPEHALLRIAVADEPAALEAATQRLASISAGRAEPVLGQVGWVDG